RIICGQHSGLANRELTRLFRHGGANYFLRDRSKTTAACRPRSSADRENMGGLGRRLMRSRVRGFTVLIVEDYALIALEIEDAVRRNGGQVLGPAAQIHDAIALIETAGCDAALLDIKLANDETAYAIAEQLDARAIPFAFITGW